MFDSYLLCFYVYRRELFPLLHSPRAIFCIFSFLSFLISLSLLQCACVNTNTHRLGWVSASGCAWTSDPAFASPPPEWLEYRPATIPEPDASQPPEWDEVVDEKWIRRSFVCTCRVICVVFFFFISNALHLRHDRTHAIFYVILHFSALFVVLFFVGGGGAGGARETVRSKMTSFFLSTRRKMRRGRRRMRSWNTRGSLSFMMSL